jgi:hypothetical protein
MKTTFPKLAFAVLTAAMMVFTATAGKPTGDRPATSTLNDFLDSSPTRIGSDGLGNYKNGVNSVSSIIQGIGDWVLDTKASSLRKVRIDFGDPVAGSGANAPFSAAVIPVRFISQCGIKPLYAMLAGESQLCGLVINIPYGNSNYSLRTGVPSAPGTDAALWNCLAADAGKCVSFQMLSNVTQADTQRKNVMQLIKLGAKPRDPDIDFGKFYMSFDVRVTTP